MNVIDISKSLIQLNSRGTQYFIDFVNRLVRRVDDNTPIIGDGPPSNISAVEGRFYLDRQAGKLYIMSDDWIEV